VGERERDGLTRYCVVCRYDLCGVVREDERWVSRGSHSLILLIPYQGFQVFQLVIPLFLVFLHLFPRFLCQSEGEWGALGGWCVHTRERERCAYLVRCVCVGMTSACATPPSSRVVCMCVCICGERERDVYANSRCCVVCVGMT